MAKSKKGQEGTLSEEQRLKRRVESLEKQLELRSALRWSERTPKPDRVPSSGIDVIGWGVHAHISTLSSAVQVSPKRASTIGHGDVSGSSGSQGTRNLFSSRIEALKAGRASIETQAAQILAEVDRCIQAAEAQLGVRTQFAIFEATSRSEHGARFKTSPPGTRLEVVLTTTSRRYSRTTLLGEAHTCTLSIKAPRSGGRALVEVEGFDGSVHDLKFCLVKVKQETDAEHFSEIGSLHFVAPEEDPD